MATALADGELGGDLPVGVSAGEEREDFHLTRGQIVRPDAATQPGKAGRREHGCDRAAVESACFHLRGDLTGGLVRRELLASWAVPAVVSWAGTRGVVPLAAALSIP